MPSCGGDRRILTETRCQLLFESSQLLLQRNNVRICAVELFFSSFLGGEGGLEGGGGEGEGAIVSRVFRGIDGLLQDTASSGN